MFFIRVQLFCVLSKFIPWAKHHEQKQKLCGGRGSKDIKYCITTRCTQGAQYTAINLNLRTFECIWYTPSHGCTHWINGQYEK